MDERLMETQLVRHIKFPIQFDVMRLQNDVRKLLSDDWVAHYNTNDYDGEWNSLSLFSVDGKSNNIYAMPPGSSDIIETDALGDCTYFKELLNSFLFRKTAVRLLRLAANAKVKPHSDHCLGYEDGSFRLHIPINTNPDVKFILDNERIIMNEGECWYINANFIHSVSNKGTEDRIHLVIDGERNDWTDIMFFKNHDESQFQKPIPKLKDSEKELIIAQLRLMNTEMANQLIANMMKE